MAHDPSAVAGMGANGAMRRYQRFLPVAVACAIALCPAVAYAACNQERAIYVDPDNAYELSFEPVETESSASSHLFKIRVLKTTLVLEGYVMGSEPVQRTNAILFDNCPDGDVTGDDIAACTVWDGVIYGNAGGKITLLPPQGATAATEILLAGFGPSLMASSAWGAGKASVVPWDAFTLKGCQP
jgi:hypothetical protein